MEFIGVKIENQVFGWYKVVSSEIIQDFIENRDYITNVNFDYMTNEVTDKDKVLTIDKTISLLFEYDKLVQITIDLINIDNLARKVKIITDTKEYDIKEIVSLLGLGSNILMVGGREHCMFNNVIIQCLVDIDLKELTIVRR